MERMSIALNVMPSAKRSMTVSGRRSQDSDHFKDQGCANRSYSTRKLNLIVLLAGGESLLSKMK